MLESLQASNCTKEMCPLFPAPFVAICVHLLPGYTYYSMKDEEWLYFLGTLGGDLTLFDSQACDRVSVCWRRGNESGHTNPSNKPSPVTAQLGTTNQILSFNCESLSASVTSWGFMAITRPSAFLMSLLK